MNNAEKTELVMAKTLQWLSDRGVQYGNLSLKDLGLNESEYSEFFGPCLKWLQAEGIIRTEDISEFMNGAARAIHPSLTSLGMSLLGQDIQVGSRTEKLSVAVKQVSEGKVDYSRIGDAIGGLLGGFTKSLGS